MLSEPLDEEQRAVVLECLILSLGAMINLAEYSDKARSSVSTGDDSILDALSNLSSKDLKGRLR